MMEKSRTPPSGGVSGGRKAYSCTPCRSKKIKCDRVRICGNCRRKEIECVWPKNGVPIEVNESENKKTGSIQDDSRLEQANRLGDTLYIDPQGSSPRRYSNAGVDRRLWHIDNNEQRVQKNVGYDNGTLSGSTSHQDWEEHESRMMTPVPEHSTQVDLPQNVALAEQFDHSILNDAASEFSDEDKNADDMATQIIGDGRHQTGRMDDGKHQGRLAFLGQEGGKEMERKRTNARSFPFNRSGGVSTGSGRYMGKGKGKALEGMITEELIVDLPERTIADALLRTYLERVEWIHHPLHLPTFLAQYNRFWSMDIPKRCQSVHARWLALLYSILALGLHFGDHQDLLLGPEGHSVREENLVMACEDSLSHSDFLNQSSIEAIQTIICLNLYLNNKDRTSEARSLLGLAIKMAVSMGLSRIPPEVGTTDPSGIVEREVGRKLWWSLVSQDAYTASTSGFTYLINLSHATTGLCANLDDEDLTTRSSSSSSSSSTPTFGRPVEIITSSTFHIAKIDFALVVRKFIDAINIDFPNAAYSEILSLDRQFRKVYNNLPKALRPDLPQPFEQSFSGGQRYLIHQRVFMGITLHNRIMRLHRGYMLRGYNDQKYWYSTEKCLESAYALLDLVKQPQSRDILCRWWVVLVHVWTGGLIIAADMVRSENKDSGRDSVKQRQGVELAISLLEPISKSSPVALRGVKVLKAMLAKHSRDVGNAMRKRKRQDSTFAIPNVHSGLVSPANGANPHSQLTQNYPQAPNIPVSSQTIETASNPPTSSPISPFLSSNLIVPPPNPLPEDTQLELLYDPSNDFFNSLFEIDFKDLPMFDLGIYHPSPENATSGIQGNFIGQNGNSFSYDYDYGEPFDPSLFQ